jgi:CheY-like chemotaxis protein
MGMMMKILVVEDDEAQLEWLERNLTSRGHDIHTAPDGDLGIAAYLMSRPFNLVITDFCFNGSKALIDGRLTKIEFIPEYDHRAVRDGAHLIELIRAVDPGQLFIVQTGAEQVDLPRGIPLLHMPYSTKRLLLEISRAHRQRFPLFPFNSESL